jgi:hypothetical protein
MTLSTISTRRDPDGNIILALADTPTGRSYQLVMTPEEARTTARQLMQHADGQQFVLAPPGDTPITDVLHAMVGAFNLMSRGSLTADNVPSKYAHLFRAVS